MSDLDSAQAVEGLRDHLLDKRWPSDPKACPPGKQAGVKAALGALCQPGAVCASRRILESAWERGYVSKNWAATKGKRAKVKGARRPAAGSTTSRSSRCSTPHTRSTSTARARTPATPDAGRCSHASSSGAMRVSEASQLQRRDVKWSRGVIHVPASKTAAGIARDVPMHRMLFDAIGEWWTRHPDQRPEALLFATATGQARDRNNIRNRVLEPGAQARRGAARERDSSDSFPTRERDDGAGSPTSPRTRDEGPRSPGGRRRAMTSAT